MKKFISIILSILMLSSVFAELGITVTAAEIHLIENSVGETDREICPVCTGKGTNNCNVDCSKCTNGKQSNTCSICNGSGKHGKGVWTTCSLCSGSGQILDAFGKYITCLCGGKGGYYKFPTCSSCSGSGKNGFVLCSACNGNGSFSYAVTCDNCQGTGSVDIFYLTFNANGGTNAPVNQKIVGTTTELPLEKPTKSGYIFGGWKSLYGNVVYQPGDAYKEDDDVLYAVWCIDCLECSGTGNEKVEYKCSSCGGSRYIKRCNSCGSYSVCHNVTGFGSYYTCNNCSSSSVSSSACSCGDGYVSTTKKCSKCTGKGYHIEESTKPNPPVIESIHKATVIIQQIDRNYEYSLNGVDWQKNPIFTNLENGVYTFYQRISITNSAEVGESSDGLTVRVHTHKNTSQSKNATYFEDGYENREVCQDCGEVISEGTIVKMLKLAKPTVTVKGGKKRITVKYIKGTGATGIQIKYKVQKSSHIITYAVTKNCKKVIEALKKGTYKVRVRALVMENGKTAYSKWTKATKVKVK